MAGDDCRALEGMAATPAALFSLCRRHLPQDRFRLLHLQLRLGKRIGCIKSCGRNFHRHPPHATSTRTGRHLAVGIEMLLWRIGIGCVHAAHFMLALGVINLQTPTIETRKTQGIV